jgi:transposase
VAAARKNAARRGATIVFLDESGFSQRPPIRRTWAPRGQTPVLIHRQRSWQQLSAIGALAYRRTPRRRALRTNVYLKTVPGPVHATEVVGFLRHLRRHVRTPMILIWDGLQAHRSREVRDYQEANRSRLTIERLPAYAPELNPVEGFWSWTKGTAVANFCPEGLAPIRRRVRRGRNRLARRGDLVESFLHKAGLFFDPITTILCEIL